MGLLLSALILFTGKSALGTKAAGAGGTGGGGGG